MEPRARGRGIRCPVGPWDHDRAARHIRRRCGEPLDWNLGVSGRGGRGLEREDFDFCSEIATLQARGTHHRGTFGRDISSNDALLLVPSLGPLTDTHLLLMTNDHHLSFGGVEASVAVRTERTVNRLRRIIEGEGRLLSLLSTEREAKARPRLAAFVMRTFTRSPCRCRPTG